MRGTFDETNPSDMVEYHVVRNGVDEEAVLSFTHGAFAEVALIQYWSSQLRVAQRFGERLGLHSSFGMVAHGYNQGGIHTARIEDKAEHNLLMANQWQV